MTRSNAEIRAEGERHVVAELRRRGIEHRLEAQGRRNDIVLRSGAAWLTVQVRVTSKGQRQGWLLSRELEGVADDRLIYAFVNTEPSNPETFLIPAGIVSDALRTSHTAWLATPGRGGRPHVDNPMRMILMDYQFPVQGYPPGWLDQFRERWDLVESR
jgi:hypothetical protein